ncbi:MAG: hypothetical protein AAF442_06185 [Pseudomonadota bacterium]
MAITTENQPIIRSSCGLTFLAAHLALASSQNDAGFLPMMEESPHASTHIRQTL